jgi:uncharacterized protein (DUF433 family)
MRSARKGLAMSNTAHHLAASKKPLDPHLFSGSKGTVDDVRVQSGFPVWNLVDAWIANGYDDEAIIRAYQLDPAEWAAAKQYYLDHKPIIDARIITNTQPDAEDDVPALRTVEDYFAWLTRNAGASAISPIANGASE